MFEQRPKCEICNQCEASRFALLTETDGGEPDWKYVCDCSMNTALVVSFADFFAAAPATIYWLAKIGESHSPSCKKFHHMMSRFHDEIHGEMDKTDS